MNAAASPLLSTRRTHLSSFFQLLEILPLIMMTRRLRVNNLRDSNAITGGYDDKLRFQPRKLFVPLTMESMAWTD